MQQTSVFLVRAVSLNTLSTSPNNVVSIKKRTVHDLLHVQAGCLQVSNIAVQVAASLLLCSVKTQTDLHLQKSVVSK